jgi:hypothetical protein
MENMTVAYVPAEGTLELRQQIGRLHHVDPDWVIVTTGASEAPAQSDRFRDGGRTGARIGEGTE